MSSSAKDIICHRRYLLALVIVCLLAVGIGIASSRRDPYLRTYDAGNYAEVARNILAGRGFTSQVVSNFYQPYPQVRHPEDRRASSWSLVLALSLLLLGKSTFALKLPNLLLGLLICPLLVYFLGRAMRMAPPAAFAGAILFLSWPHWLQASLTAEADVLFTGLTILILLLIVASHQHIGWILLASALLGLSYTVKPAALFLVVPLGLYSWLALRSVPTRQRAQWLVAALLVTLVAASPMLVRNYIAFGSPLYSTNLYTAGQMGFDDSGRALMHVYWDEQLPSLPQALRTHGLAGLLTKTGNQLVAATRNIFGGVGLFFLVPCLLVLIGRRSNRRLRLGWLALGIWVVELAVLWAIRPRLLLPFLPLVTLSAGAGGLALAERFMRRPRYAASLLLSIVMVIAGVGTGGYCWWHYQHQADRTVLASYLTAANWIGGNLPAGTVVMSHHPYLVRFYSDHPLVQLPFDRPEKIAQVISHYGVSAVVVQQSPPPQRWASELPRSELAEIAHHRGWQVVYEAGEVEVHTALDE